MPPISIVLSAAWLLMTMMWMRKDGLLKVGVVGNVAVILCCQSIPGSCSVGSHDAVGHDSNEADQRRLLNKKSRNLFVVHEIHVQQEATS